MGNSQEIPTFRKKGRKKESTLTIRVFEEGERQREAATLKQVWLLGFKGTFKSPHHRSAEAMMPPSLRKPSFPWQMSPATPILHFQRTTEKLPT